MNRRAFALLAGGLLVAASLMGCAFTYPERSASAGDLVVLHGGGDNVTVNVLYPEDFVQNSPAPHTVVLPGGDVALSIPLDAHPGDYTVRGAVDGDPIILTLNVS